jgi:hypothetical protein
MWRYAARIATILLIGAAINILVAWGCAARFDAYPPNVAPMLQGDVDRMWSSYALDTFPPHPDTAIEVSMFGFTWCELGTGGEGVTHLAAGFPLRSLEGYAVDRPAHAAVRSGLWETDWPFPFLSQSSVRWFPCSPRWVPFSLNTMLFAATFAMLIEGRVLLRRWRRTRRHRCPPCGYPVSPSLVCSECGAPRTS